MGGAWTAERLDDLNRRVETGFAEVHADIRALNQTVVRVGGGLVVGMILGFLGVIGGLVGIMVGA